MTGMRNLVTQESRRKKHVEGDEKSNEAHDHADSQTLCQMCCAKDVVVAKRDSKIHWVDTLQALMVTCERHASANGMCGKENHHPKTMAYVEEMAGRDWRQMAQERTI